MDLQSDSNVKKISAHITKKVADKLEEMFKNDRADFEKKWDDIRTFMQYGVLTDEKFFERAEKFMLLKNTEGNYFTIDEYEKKIETLQKDKNGTLVHLYATNMEEQYAPCQEAARKAFISSMAASMSFLRNAFQKRSAKPCVSFFLTPVYAGISPETSPVRTSLLGMASTNESVSLSYSLIVMYPL